jgi:predicted nucleotidyltransferase
VQDRGSDLVDTLRQALAGDPRLRLAMLLGSRARSRAREDSDVDIGILPVDPDLPLREELELQARVERACGHPVDLVRLDRADVLLRWEVARHGILLFAAARSDLVRFVARASLDHADLAPAIDRSGALFRRRLLAEGAGGGVS